ncbi:MAG: response regulator [Magnetococcales bacterium]|nr:response regulator [Magnetococcales bacterium]
MPHSSSLPRLITITSGIIAGLICLLPPLIHLFLSGYHVHRQVHMELRIHTLVLNRFISTHPDTWSVQSVRLAAALEEIHTSQTTVRVHHLADGARKVASQVEEALPWPRWTHGEHLYDYGEVVGEVEVTLTLRPIVISIVLTFLVSVFLGLMVFFPLRTLSMRIMRQSMAALADAKELAEEASRVKSDFFANMSHELRTPMNAIIGLTELALQTELSSRTRDYLLKVVNASHFLLRIINDILDFSKIEAGKLEMEAVDFVLGERFDHLSDLFQCAVDEKRLTLILPRTPECGYVLTGDPLRLEQILSNLLGNAIKFTPSGQVEVGVGSLEPVAGQPAGSVCLEFFVRDTGIGLTREQIGKLFRPFAQADGSTTRKYGGTGLGLTICKRLVELMHGTIRVTSQPNRGSTFFFTILLPRQVAKEGGRLPEGRRERGGSSLDAGAVRGRIGGARVLLVEDNDINCQVAREILQGVGLVVEVAENGWEGLQKCGRATFDLVLMDLQMPVMDGFTATRRMREQVALQGMPIVAMTAHTMVEERERCLAAGMNDHVAKPIDRQQLFAALLRWIPPREGIGGGGELPDALPGGDLLPPRIPGIDMEAVMERLDGNQTLLRTLLLEFQGSYASAPERIAAVLTRNLREERLEAARLLHSIKGIAGNLSAMEVYESARALEAGLVADEATGLPERFDRFAGAMRVLLAFVPTLTVGARWDGVPAHLPPVDRERVTNLLRELAGFIQDQDFNALARLEELRPCLTDSMARASFDRLAADLDRFDFATARTDLATLAGHLGMPESC